MLAFRHLDVIIAQPGFNDENARVLIVWQIVRQHSGLEDVTFRIERSQSPQFTDGEFVELVAGVEAAPGQFVYEFDDITANLQSWWRRYFWRVVASTPDGEIVSATRTWETEPRPHEIAIIESHDFVLKYLQGAPTFAFVERTAEALHCICWNPTTSRSNNSQCTLCLGTGRQRPFFEPIPFYVDYNPDEKLVAIANFGEMQDKQKDCWSSAFPMLKPGDILYEVVPATLWRIVRVQCIQPQGTTIQHLCRISAVGKEDVEYRGLPGRIPAESLQAIVQEWETIKAERLF